MFFVKVNVFLLLQLFLIRSNDTYTRVFKTLDSDVVDAGDLGKIRGLISKTRNTGRTFYQFTGIPYSIPPIGSNRFLPSKINTGLLTSNGSPFNATNFGSPCPQPTGGSEDCLFLNVATPDLQSDELLPVIVYIHGAAFVRGNANIYGGEYLLRDDLVIVSFNYRLGVFGYFGMSTDAAPGNSGLYDALTALEWVQKYIRYFGGNPDLVTLAGQSSGSASVTHLILSPLSDGLFHRAIALSGTSLNDWATTVNPKQGGLRIAQLTNCYNSSLEISAAGNLDMVLNCMRSKSQNELIQAQEKYQAVERLEGRHGFNGLSPSITFQDLEIIPTLIPDFPINILKNKEQNNVPLMIGATKQDGEFPLGVIYATFLLPNNLQNNSRFLSDRFVSNILESLGYHTTEEGTKEMEKTYLGNCRHTGNFSQMLPGIMDICTVLFFKAAALQLAELHSRLSPTYLYSFNFKGTHTKHHPHLPFPGGVAHSDDTIYLFPVQDFDFNSDEMKVSNALIDYWSNFAKYGFPGNSSNITWPKFDEDGNYLIINKETIVDDNYKGKWIGASKYDFGENRCSDILYKDISI